MKLQRFLMKYTNALTFLAGIFTALGLIFARLPGWGGASAIVYLIAAALAGFPILVRAVQGLRFKVVGIELLVSIAVLGACWIGEFSEAAIVTFLFQFGSFLEQKTMAKTRGAIKALTDLAPTTAWRREGDTFAQIDADEIEIGDRLLVKTGGQIAADGVVAQGEGYVNEASVTGESVPVHKKPGDVLYAGTILDSGTLEMDARKVGEDTTFAKIIALVEEAQDAKSPAERFIDRFARYYTPAVVLIAALTLLFTRNPDTAITVLVLACPGALVIGAPIANVAGIGRGAREGVLLKGGDSIHTFARTDTFVFDKTGTLTWGRPQVVHAVLLSVSGEEALARAVWAESTSDHPLGKALLEYAKEKSIAPIPCGSVQTLKGLGLSAEAGGERLLVGSPRLLEQSGNALPERLCDEVHTWQNKCATVVLVAYGNEPAVLLAIADALKPDAAESIRALKAMGISRTLMLTGDNPQTARAVADQLGIQDIRAELLPQDKLAQVEALQRQGCRVTFVGDGINDSPALTAADTGIAMGSGTDAAMDCSDVVLMRSDLNSLVTALALARRTQRILRENIIIAVGTVIALLIGLFVGYIHMSIGMLIHEGSILLVIFNAMRLTIGGTKK